jgi:hypothetical protein
MPVNGVFYSQTKGLVFSTNSLNRVFVQTGGTTTFTGITSGNTIVEVQGVSGQVFKVTDCSNGVLFSSNNVSGQPILQTNSCGSIIGGIGSSSSANATTIGGGCNNSTSANYTTIGGGLGNNTNGDSATIGGGRNNIAEGIFATIGGGQYNCVSSSYGVIGGGGVNNVSSAYATIVGGKCNVSSCYYSTIGGGQSNTSSSRYTTIGGGRSNTASYYYSTIGGGRSNTASCCYSTIGGGQYNVASNYHSTVGGGNCNQANAQCSTIGGGVNNYIDSQSRYSTIGGGAINCIFGSSCCSGIFGGQYNSINGLYNSFIIGSNITANSNNYTFVNNLCSIGQVNKAGGTFKISHPDPKKTETHYLLHSFVESPTAGDNIYRYEVKSINGLAEIELPDYFKYLNENTQIWVNGKNNFGSGYGRINDELTKITIHTNIDGEYNVLVIGTRKDEHAKKHWKGAETLKEKMNK